MTEEWNTRLTGRDDEPGLIKDQPTPEPGTDFRGEVERELSEIQGGEASGEARGQASGGPELKGQGGATDSDVSETALPGEA